MENAYEMTGKYGNICIAEQKEIDELVSEYNESTMLENQQKMAHNKLMKRLRKQNDRLINKNKKQKLSPFFIAGLAIGFLFSVVYLYSISG